ELLLADLGEMERENESILSKLASAASANILESSEKIGGVKVIEKQVNAKDMRQLRQFVDNWKDKKIGGILVLGAVQGDKVNLISAVSEESIKAGYLAGKLLKEVATRCGGTGGGRPDMAQAGGKNPAELGNALD
ncbi:DHHA1 domain-containing protein, partial [Listeria monocytogenes]|uniref:DHHA1 domain-containing protein n=1 Tax=Listeria monocytogenes TaxID=1639 RepID=UPI0034A31A5B